MHLLFLRIHPYGDGNGRTARIIHNLKFTETINKLYGMKLKISPLNLSDSILLNKITYVKKIDNIYFDLEHKTSEQRKDILGRVSSRIIKLCVDTKKPLVIEDFPFSMVSCIQSISETVPFTVTMYLFASFDNSYISSNII